MRIDPPGFGTINTNSFPIQQSPVIPISVSGMTASSIENLFSYLPEGELVSQSGVAHTEAGRILGSIADVLVRHVQVLHENWSGHAAEAAVGNFEQLHQTAIGLAQASTQTGAVLSWVGGLITPLNSYKAPGKGTAADQAAQAAMDEFNGNLVTANSNLPTKVTKNLPTGTNYNEPIPLIPGSTGSVAAGAAAAAANPTGGDESASPAQADGGGHVTGVGTNPGGGTGPAGGVSPNTGTGSTTPVTKLAGLPPGGTPGTGTGTGTPGGSVPGGSVPGGNVPGGNTGPTGTDPLGTVPVPSGNPGSDNPGNPAPNDGDVEPVGLGGAPGEGGDPGVGGFTGESAEQVGLVNVPGQNGDPGLGGFTGENAEQAGLGTMPGEDGGMLPFGSMSGDPGIGGLGGGSAGVGGNGAGGQGLVAEDITGESPADDAVIGPDGMIGTGPGGLDAGMDGGFASGNVGVGNSGATGFVGADDALGDPAAGSGDGLPMTGGSGSGEPARERRRQAWMMEDADLWEGPAEHVPSQIGG
jgi:hypothetical protein